MASLACFKAYDIRGRVPEDLNEDLAFKIGRAYCQFVRPKKVAVGYDIRLSSLSITQALQKGLMSSGADVVDIGLSGTEQLYFATFHLQLDGGIMVTASHNPKQYNGMKFTREKAIPISADTGLKEMEKLTLEGQFDPCSRKGKVEKVDIMEKYIDHLMGYVHPSRLKPLRIVCNPGNGCAGPVLRRMEKRLPFKFILVHETPDGNFPNGVPNPLLPENRKSTADVVIREKADLGVAWDGDFDRCFFFDETGEFIESYYILGFLASQLVAGKPGAKVVHDPRLTWNTVEMVGEKGGKPVQCKSGHAFIKEKMRLEDAVYGGEMSAHHYFRDFSYCDSGMIPWLLMAEVMCDTGKKLSELVADRMSRYPISGEINRELKNPAGTLRDIRARYAPHAESIDETDGVTMDMGQWKFNLRTSNTEPVVRLNVETRGDEALLKEKTDEILGLL